MKLKHSLALIPLAFASLVVNAETVKTEQSGSTFHFSTQVSRTVEKDLMEASVFSRKTGKNLAELKKSVSDNLNAVLEAAKKDPSIEVTADGISNYTNYDNKGKISSWVAEGTITLKGKNFEAIAKILENLGSEVGISNVHFSVSPEKMASLEDEMTLEIIKQFQHKAGVIQKGLNAGKYTLSDIQLNTPNGDMPQYQTRMYAAKSYEAQAQMASTEAADVPLEAGKQTISASASGKVVFE